MAKKNPQPLLDLHGYKTDEVFEALEKFIARHQSKKTIYVMTGKGSGKVKAKAMEYLKMARYPFSDFRDELGNKNPGILSVHMD